MKPFICPICQGRVRRNPPDVYKYSFTCNKCGAYYFGKSKKVVRQVIKDIKSGGLEVIL
jgi:ribosomal protein L37AE/L43A